MLTDLEKAQVMGCLRLIAAIHDSAEAQGEESMKLFESYWVYGEPMRSIWAMMSVDGSIVRSPIMYGWGKH